METASEPDAADAQSEFKAWKQFEGSVYIFLGPLLGFTLWVAVWECSTIYSQIMYLGRIDVSAFFGIENILLRIAKGMLGLIIAYISGIVPIWFHRKLSRLFSRYLTTRARRYLAAPIFVSLPLLITDFIVLRGHVFSHSWDALRELGLYAAASAFLCALITEKFGPKYPACGT